MWAILECRYGQLDTFHSKMYANITNSMSVLKIYVKLIENLYALGQTRKYLTRKRKDELDKKDFNTSLFCYKEIKYVPFGISSQYVFVGF